MTRAERQRSAVDARARYNLRSLAITRSVMQAGSDTHRDVVLTRMRGVIAQLDAQAVAAPSRDEIVEARAHLATDPQAPQCQLFRGNR